MPLSLASTLLDAMDRRLFLETAGLGLAPLIAGCLGGSGGDGATPTQQGAQAAFPDYEWSNLDDANVVAATTIEMVDTSFRPLVAAFEPGTEVTVTNRDDFKHTITVPKLDIDETVGGGASTTITVQQTGTYDYVCRLHPPGMLGRLEVTNNPPTDSPTEGGTGDESTPTEGGGLY